MSAARPSQTLAPQAQDAFEMSDQRLDLLSITPRLLVSFATRNGAGDIAGRLWDLRGILC